MHSKILDQNLVAECRANFINTELFMVLTGLSFLEVDDFETCIVAHITQVDVDDVEDLSDVITKGSLDQSRVERHPTVQYHLRFLVDLLTLEDYRTELFMFDLSDPALALIEVNVVVLHADTFREDLIGQALWSVIQLHDLILDRDLAVSVALATLSDLKFLCLRQYLIVLLQPDALDLLQDCTIGVILGDHDTIRVEKQAQLQLALIGVIVFDLVYVLLCDVRPHEPTFNTHSNLLHDVLLTVLADLHLGL